MSVWRLSTDRAAEAVEVLLEVFPDFPGSNRLGPVEERRIARLLNERTVESGLAIGRIDAWGDPPVGVTVWLRRPALDGPEPPRPPRPRLRDLLPADVVGALERFEATMQRLRAISRPDAHVYLDTIGVLPAHRRQGIATALMEAGHSWADDLGLPVALDTDSPPARPGSRSRTRSTTTSALPWTGREPRTPERRHSWPGRSRRTGTCAAT